jgi:Copper type II ascorbate-dependent monooxygenase, C-terminal domain
MRVVTKVSFGCLSVVVAACSSKAPSTPASTNSGGSTDAGVATDGGLSTDAGVSTDGGLSTISTELDVTAGTETFMCQLVTFPQGGYVTYQAHDFTPGSHHFLLYTTDLDAIPPGESGVHDCGEAGGAIQSHIRGVFYGAQSPHRTFTFPPGVGLPVTKGQVLLLQVHYLNPTAATLHVSVNAYFGVDEVGTGITTEASNLFWYDPFIDVPAGQRALARMRCPVPNDITLLYAASHYHKRGVGYGAYLDVTPDQVAAKPFYTSTNWEDPEPLAQPVQVAAGSRIRFECDYDNTAGTSDFFQGQSALTNEMCVFAATYYPKMPGDTDFCRTGGDMFGAGQASCVDTVNCLGRCNSGDAGSGGVTSCSQACIVGSCAAFSDAAIGLSQCISGSCLAACSPTPADDGGLIEAGDEASAPATSSTPMVSDSCKACLLAACPAIAAQCASDTACPASPGGP